MDKQQVESISTTSTGQGITGAGTDAGDMIKPAGVDVKGKGKAVTIKGASKDETMDDDDDDLDNVPDDDDDDEEEEEEEGSDEDLPDDEVGANIDDEDDLREITTDNIISGGRRTRGKIIDFAKAAEDAGDDLPEDEDDDAEFPDPHSSSAWDGGDAMQE